MENPPFFSIIVPVYNGGEPFSRCLQSIQNSKFSDWELIVVNDGSTDNSPKTARAFGAAVLHISERCGPAAARNLGANHARGEYLFFLDADCEMLPDTLRIAAETFRKHPDLDAIIGSYDDSPSAENFISQYKNLAHRFVHQTSREEASTFWTGCGAITRKTFLELGGFDAQKYPRPSIEDIELGYRLIRRGRMSRIRQMSHIWGKIRLVKSMQVKHLKKWTFVSLLKSDIFDRGIPWVKLILESGTLQADLNLRIHHRISVLLVIALCNFVWLSFIYPPALWGIGLTTFFLLVLNRRFYGLFYRNKGLVFTIRAIPLHWLFYLYNFVAFLLGTISFMLDKDKTHAPPICNHQSTIYNGKPDSRTSR